MHWCMDRRGYQRWVTVCAGREVEEKWVWGVPSKIGKVTLLFIILFSVMEQYTNYYKTHSWYALWASLDVAFLDLKAKVYWINIWHIMQHLPKDAKILEIWCGKWEFAYFCHKLWFTNYVWFDLDPFVIEENKKNYPHYTFSGDDAFVYLESNKVDIVFMSHVFEHLTLEEWQKLSRLIHKSLNPGWQWVNVMPNASSLSWSSFGRYNDITHKIIYTPNSFNQVLLQTWFMIENIQHKNAQHRIYIVNVVRKIMRCVVGFFCFFFWYPADSVTTFEIWSFMEKK